MSLILGTRPDRLNPSDERGLVYDDAVRQRTEALYPLVRDLVTPMEWPALAPLIDGVRRLKAERGAVILAHNYMTPDIFRLIGDFRGDSLQLAMEAAATDAPVIVQAGVHFMAETSKILSPEKTVLIPDMRAGCSLAASITGADVRLIRQAWPGVPICTYVNTSAEVKAESDITCTSSNAIQAAEHIAREWGVKRVIMIPDEFLARNVAANTDLSIIAWRGRCEVHESFSGRDIAEIRAAHPGVTILAHPECPPDVLEEADFAGSTSAIAHFVRERSPRKVVLLTECSMSDNIAADNPGVEFLKPCNLCPHMKRITVANIYDALRDMKHVVEVDEDIRIRARRAIEAMLALPRPTRPATFLRGRPPVPVELI
jgi:quinolinate synthase